jgi:copper chaperone CopZ
MTIHPLEGLHCGACVKKVESALAPLAAKVTVSLQPMQVTLINRLLLLPDNTGFLPRAAQRFKPKSPPPLQKA